MNTRLRNEQRFLILLTKKCRHRANMSPPGLLLYFRIIFFIAYCSVKLAAGNKLHHPTVKRAALRDITNTANEEEENDPSDGRIES